MGCPPSYEEQESMRQQSEIDRNQQLIKDRKLFEDVSALLAQMKNLLPIPLDGSLKEKFNMLTQEIIKSPMISEWFLSELRYLMLKMWQLIPDHIKDVHPVKKTFMEQKEILHQRLRYLDPILDQIGTVDRILNQLKAILKNKLDESMSTKFKQIVGRELKSLYNNSDWNTEVQLCEQRTLMMQMWKLVPEHDENYHSMRTKIMGQAKEHLKHRMEDREIVINNLKRELQGIKDDESKKSALQEKIKSILSIPDHELLYNRNLF